MKKVGFFPIKPRKNHTGSPKKPYRHLQNAKVGNIILKNRKCGMKCYISTVLYNKVGNENPTNNQNNLKSGGVYPKRHYKIINISTFENVENSKIPRNQPHAKIKIFQKWGEKPKNTPFRVYLVGEKVFCFLRVSSLVGGVASAMKN